MTPAIAPRVRTVLDAPHGRRFSSPPAPPSARRPTRDVRAAREQALLDQMRDNPWVAHRLEHGELPAWMRATPVRPESPKPVPEPRQRRKHPAHRRHRRRVPALVLDAIGYPLAVTAGALAHHLGTLLGQLT
ncbi:hypothetical protein NI17_004395 [Thermobifida halotolerans]|uniref:Uncharacterized protein n=1 Tax=Thermobifida halotolerans TaxID=483545 RepID=A0A399G532_9ACTN|nr:hypothetical protein [Thermobifida halotolerans]UOE20473.1 hypothetical protein NI17_004395 [Thermobifida halotolerans]